MRRDLQGHRTTEHDWNDVVMETAFLGPNWQSLAINLGLSHYLIDSIKMEVKPSDSLSEALKRWIKQNYNTKRYGKPSWRKLLRAVAQVDKLQFKTLADKHKKIKGMKTSPIIYSPSKNSTLPLMAITTGMGVAGGCGEDSEGKFAPLFPENLAERQSTCKSILAKTVLI